MDAVQSVQEKLLLVYRHRMEWVGACAMTGLLLLASKQPVFERFAQPEDGKIPDATLAFPHHEDTVSFADLMFVGFATPLSLGVLINIYKAFRAEENEWDWFHDLHNLLLFFFQSLTFSQAVGEIIKVKAGRLRPDFYERVNGDINIREGRRSFPSGHTTFAFMSMTVTALYLVGKSGIYHSLTKRAESSFISHTRFLRLVLSFGVPMAYAVYVAITRTIDYRHNFSDINAGAMIGMICTTSVYFLHFEPLTSPFSHYPRDSYKQIAVAKKWRKATARAVHDVSVTTTSADTCDEDV